VSELFDEVDEEVRREQLKKLWDKYSIFIIAAAILIVAAVGGYRFLAQDLQEWGKRLGQGALLTALPDRLSGHRLAGRSQDNARARDALSELGLNPLMVEAFRDRSGAV